MSSDALQTILVIDDNPDVRSTLEFILEDLGFQVALARNGTQGIAAYRAISPDLVFTDILMPEQDGIETIRQLRREFLDAKIVAMSGSRNACPSDDYLTIARKLGADAAILKPFVPEEIESTLRLVLSCTPNKLAMVADGAARLDQRGGQLREDLPLAGRGQDAAWRGYPG